MGPCFGIEREQDDACCLPVDSVYWHQVQVACGRAQAVQQAFVDVTAAWSHRKEVWLAGHQQIVILKEYLFGKRNDGFVADLAEIHYLCQRCVRGLRRYRTTLGINDLASVDALRPDVGGDVREALDQERQDGGIGRLR